MYRFAAALFMFLLTINLFPQAFREPVRSERPPAARSTEAALSSAALSSAVPSPPAPAQPLGERIVPGRLVIIYRGGAVPANADAVAAFAGARAVAHLRRLGVSAMQVDLQQEAAAIARLQSQPEVAAVLEDRYVQGHALLLRPGQLHTTLLASGSQTPTAAPNPDTAFVPAFNPIRSNAGSPVPQSIQAGPAPILSQPLSAPRPISTVRLGQSSTASTPAPSSSPAPAPAPAPLAPPATDSSYNSPQGWAVQQSGGYGDNIPGGPSTGPWTTTLGAGVRIAILDSGVDENHPDIAPNLALNLSEVDQTALPSPCDDGSPQDQQGHGTWAASLAAAALGGGQVAGVAPQATLLNIKVLQRMPAATGATLTAQCEAGQPGGLLSWVLQGINDAIANHANVISVSLGTLVDITTGDGAGWQAAFNSATYAASQTGVVIVAALGNDGLNLSPTGPNAKYIELPAQSRGVLPVTASTNPACAENLTTGAACAPGPVTRPYYSNYGVAGALAAPGGSYPEGTDTGVSGFIRGACSGGLTNTSDGLPLSAIKSTTQPASGSPAQSFGCFNLGHAASVQAMGTSASAPLAAGAAAILRAAHPGWTAAQIVAALVGSATITSSMAEPQLNLAAALASAP